MPPLHPLRDSYYYSFNSSSATVLADDLDSDPLNLGGSCDAPQHYGQPSAHPSPVAVSSFKKANANDLARPLMAYSGTESITRSPSVSSQTSKHLLSPLLQKALKDCYPESDSFGKSMDLLVEDWKELKLSLESRSSDEEVSDSDRMSVDEGTFSDAEPVEVEFGPDREPNDELESHRRISTTTVGSSTEAEQDPEETQVGQRFACPYFQRNPARYKHLRPCVGPGFKDIGKLKEHIYRRHRLKITCCRCSMTFQHTADRDLHSRAANACEPKPSKEEGCSPEQEQLLRSRKRPPGSVGRQTEVQKWEDIYTILFPNEPRIPSPFYEDSDDECCRHTLNNFKSLVLTALPEEMRQAIETYSSTRSLIERIQDRSQRTRLVDIVISRTREQMDKSLRDPLLMSRISHIPAPSEIQRSNVFGRERERPSDLLDARSGFNRGGFPRTHHPTVNHSTASGSRRRAGSDTSPEAKEHQQAVKKSRN